MLNLNSLLIGSSNPKALADFYKKVLEKEPDMQEDQWFGFSTGSCFLSIGPHDKVTGKSSNPERILLNFETTNVLSEFERIKNLGATVIAEPYAMDESGKKTQGEPQVATFADPDGNYFQLVIPWDL